MSGGSWSVGRDRFERAQGGVPVRLDRPRGPPLAVRSRPASARRSLTALRVGAGDARGNELEAEHLGQWDVLPFRVSEHLGASLGGPVGVAACQIYEGACKADKRSFELRQRRAGEVGTELIAARACDGEITSENRHDGEFGERFDPRGQIVFTRQRNQANPELFRKSNLTSSQGSGGSDAARLSDPLRVAALFGHLECFRCMCGSQLDSTRRKRAQRTLHFDLDEHEPGRIHCFGPTEELLRLVELAVSGVQVGKFEQGL